MTTVALIVTGDLELKSLGASLERLFPGVKFLTEKANGFTSNRISLPLPDMQTDADKLARRVIAAVDPGRTGEPADFAMVVDDLELPNHDQPDVVCDYFGTRSSASSTNTGPRPRAWPEPGSSCESAVPFTSSSR